MRRRSWSAAKVASCEAGSAFDWKVAVVALAVAVAADFGGEWMIGGDWVTAAKKSVGGWWGR